ncbi:SLAP domain-containing protein, partial [Lactobacillus acidophilus]
FFIFQGGKDHMKKNLRIVSAAAAALLAVAPVAASAVSTVNAAAVNAIAVGGSATPLPNNSDVQISSSVAGVTTKNGSSYTNGRISGSINASYNGTSYSANFSSSNAGVVVSTPGHTELSGEQINGLEPGSAVTVTLRDGVSFNFGSTNANKTITLAFPKNVSAAGLADANKVSATSETSVDAGKTIQVKTDKNGVVSFGSAQVLNVKVVETSDVRAVSFYDIQTGKTVENGTLSIVAGSNARANVQEIVNAFNAKYQASQLNNANSNANVRLTDNNAQAVATMLRAQNIDVDAQGYFTAPASLSLTFHAESTQNNETAQLPVTVSVTNGKEVTPSTVDSVSKRIMHNAYYYDKDAKRVGTDSVKRYNSVSVLPNTTTINGKAYYQVVENGKAVDKYINAANIDGTKRTLKHNAYVYASSKKRANKVVLKKGEVVTTYGASYTFKNGQKYYKIGDNTDKTYVKVANFR